MGFHDPVWTRKKYNPDGSLKYLRNYYWPEINWLVVVGIIIGLSPLVCTGLVVWLGWFDGG